MTSAPGGGPAGDAGCWLRYADEPDLPDGTSVDGCASHYQLMGKSDLESEGHLHMRYLPCYCVECAAERYESCVVKDLVGEFHNRTSVPGSASALSALRLFRLHPPACQQKVHCDVIGDAFGQFYRGCISDSAGPDFRQGEAGGVR